MSNLYPPEGRLLHTPDNQAACASLPALLAAIKSEAILEGRAVLCTPSHDLSVRLGPFTGIIPREEAALGIREGKAREIAILSRVGKPVAFTVTQRPEDGRFLLSRRRAQELALDHLAAQPPGTVLPAVITHLAGFGAFADVGCGVVSMVGIENCSVSRIAHPACRFSLEQAVFVVLTGVDPEAHRVYLSHKELLGTWEENAARFSPGMTVPGIVRGIKAYGAFIELAPNLSGLAERTEGLEENQRVSVYIKSIQPQTMKVKLSVIGPLEDLPGPPPLPYFITSGRVLRWDYSPPGCTRSRISRDFSQPWPLTASQ